jgi:polyhydroxybutyrate depolymerase
MVSRVLAILGVVLVVAGCTARETDKTSAFVDGTSVYTISVGGLERTYRLHKPAGLPAAAPLVVMLHGGFGNGAQAEKAYGWDKLADSSKFVVAYPDGLNRAWNVNGGGCCGKPAKEGIDDVAFITAAVSDVGNNVNIDASRVYVTGISNGGIMSYTLACNTGIFAAIGPDSATQLDPCRFPRLTSVMHIHGTADRLIRYDGGPGAGVAHIDGPPVPELNAVPRLLRPAVRSRRQPPDAQTTAASCLSPSRAAVTNGRASPPRSCGNFSPPTPTSHYMYCATVEKM